MIMRIVNAVLSRWQLSLGILAALVLSHTLAYCEGREDGANAEKIKQAVVERKAVEEARKRDEAAGAVVRKEQDDVDAKVQRARDAAQDSSDPLRSFLDSLRGRPAGPDPAAD
jgi:hypothetical protein